MQVIGKLSHWYFSKKALPYWCVLTLDFLIVLVSGYVACLLVFGWHSFVDDLGKITMILVPGLVFFGVSFRIFKTYSGIIRFSSFLDLGRIVVSVFMACLLLRLTSHMCHVMGLVLVDLRWSVIFIMFTMSVMIMWLERILVKVLYDVVRRSADTVSVFIYGVQAGAVALAKSVRNADPVTYNLRGFINPDPDSSLSWLSGVTVYPDDDQIVAKAKELHVGAVLVSPMQSNCFRERDALINMLIDAGIGIRMFPSEEEWDGKSELLAHRLREVRVEDLLPRSQISVDMDAIRSFLEGRRILITGAAGSIGSEIVRQVSSFGPSELVLIDQAETPMHDIRLMMAGEYPSVKAHTIVTSITRKERMESIFREYRPEYVFHSAAYKHVPMMEDNPAEAVQNNIYGTRVIADLAVKYGTEKFVMISTDKAVNPTNVMGCSKRICEIYCQSLNGAIASGKVKGVTQFVTTRFGNVLGSNGSVIPIFREQIAKGGPVTVTHPDIIRFFMLIPEACKLVLEAGTMGNGGEIFVFDMGKPVRIVDMAQRMIKLSGAKDVKIEFSGLRGGEKLYEEVLAEAEHTRPTSHPKIHVAAVRDYDYDTAREYEDRLVEASYGFDDMEIVRLMKEIVPEFKSRHSKYEVLD